FFDRKSQRIISGFGCFALFSCEVITPGFFSIVKKSICSRSHLKHNRIHTTHLMLVQGPEQFSFLLLTLQSRSGRPVNIRHRCNPNTSKFIKRMSILSCKRMIRPNQNDKYDQQPVLSQFIIFHVIFYTLSIFTKLGSSLSFLSFFNKKSNISFTAYPDGPSI